MAVAINLCCESACICLGHIRDASQIVSLLFLCFSVYLYLCDSSFLSKSFQGKQLDSVILFYVPPALFQVQVIFEPVEVTIIKERMLQGVFDVVVGRRARGQGELVVFVPQRHAIPEIHRQSISRLHTGRPSLIPPFSLPSGQLTDYLSGRRSAKLPSIRSFTGHEKRRLSSIYRGFAFGFEVGK